MKHIPIPDVTIVKQQSKEKDEDDSTKVEKKEKTTTSGGIVVPKVTVPKVTVPKGHKCEALKKKDGKRCSKIASISLTPDATKSMQTYFVCKIHLEHPPDRYVTDPPIEWNKVDVKGQSENTKTVPTPVPSDKNDATVTHRIRNKLKSGPKKSDGPGWIYVYFLDHERGLNYYKIGFTQRRVSIRSNEWITKHYDENRSRVVFQDQFQVTTSAVKYCERLIHLYLDYCRMRRKPWATRTMHSQWYSSHDRAVIEDGQQYVDDDDDGDGKRGPAAMTSHVEWFCIEWSEADRVIRELVNFCNAQQDGE